MDEQKKLPEINATVKKPPSLMAEIFKYTMEEVFIPRSKDAMRDFMASMVNMFSDAATKSIDKAIYKDEVPRRTNKNSNSSTFVTSHTKYNTTVVSRNENTQKPSINTRSSTDINEVWVKNEEDAKKIINTLKEEIDNYGKAKVATLYGMLRDEDGNPIPTTYADFKFGWTDANQLSYYKDRGQYYIDLPRPQNIENVN